MNSRKFRILSSFMFLMFLKYLRAGDPADGLDSVVNYYLVNKNPYFQNIGR